MNTVLSIQGILKEIDPELKLYWDFRDDAVVISKGQKFIRLSMSQIFLRQERDAVRMIVDAASRLQADQLSNEVGQIIRYEGRKPEYVSAPPVYSQSRCSYCGTLSDKARCDSCGAPR